MDKETKSRLGQCLFEALKAFRNAGEVKTERKIYKIRSLSCLTAAGHHKDCLKGLDELITESPTADQIQTRAHKLMNQPSLCAEDVTSALMLEPTCREAEELLMEPQEASEEARQQAVLRTLSGQLKEALCLINTALEISPQDGRLYLFRGTLYRRLKDFTSAIDDLVQAVELSEEGQVSMEVRGQARDKVKNDKSDSVQEEAQLQLALTYNDFAVQCFSRGLYTEATLLLNKAIKEEKGLAGLYLNRGDCFFKQGDWPYALLDYQQAEEMLPPDDPAVRLRLAVVHNTLGSFCFQDGCFQEAAEMFSLAIKYNPTVSRYYESRSKAFRRILNVRGAREDFICMLILDPNNEEAPPMLMSLFPGSSVSEVLSSTKGRAIRSKLVETTRAWSSSSDPVKLSQIVQKMSLTNKNVESPSGKLSEAAKELRVCVNEKDMKKITKALLQVEEAAESSIPEHPTLHHSRPQLITHLQPPSSTSTGPPSRDLERLETTSQK